MWCCRETINFKVGRRTPLRSAVPSLINFPQQHDMECITLILYRFVEELWCMCSDCTEFIMLCFADTVVHLDGG